MSKDWLQEKVNPGEWLKEGQIAPAFCSNCGMSYPVEAESETSQCPDCGTVSDHSEWHWRLVASVN